MFFYGYYLWEKSMDNYIKTMRALTYVTLILTQISLYGEPSKEQNEEFEVYK